MGLCGWLERGHDAAACLFVDGKLVAMAEEERFTRKRHAYDCLPHHAAFWCLREAQLPLSTVQEIAIGWDIPYVYQLAKRPLPFRTDQELIEQLFPQSIFGQHNFPKVSFVNHHLAHAASVSAMMVEKRAGILVIDGQGEDDSTTIWLAQGSVLRKLASFPVSHSLGYFFEAASRRCGFSTTHAGKVMALAAYGNDRGWQDPFAIDSDGYEPVIPIPDQQTGLDNQAVVVERWERFFNDHNFPVAKRDYRLVAETGRLGFDSRFSNEIADFAWWVQSKATAT
ncbi:hypothetical protein HYZ64_03430, partial [Candidatus Berkelbacteria bacterium]|nr:hypothetical protein [Candidatus Berkelbacteria bacterium]